MSIWINILSTSVVYSSIWMVINYSWCVVFCSYCAFYILSTVILHRNTCVPLPLLHCSVQSEYLCSLCNIATMPTFVLGRRCVASRVSLVHSLILRLVSWNMCRVCVLSSSVTLPLAKVYPIAVLCSYSVIDGSSYLGGPCLNGVSCIFGVLLVYGGFMYIVGLYSYGGHYSYGGFYSYGGPYYYGGLYFYGGLFSIGGPYTYNVLCQIIGVLSITNTNISNNGGATDGINNNNCVTNIYVICLCYQYALHSALSVIIMYVIYVLIIMFIINYNNHSTINAILHNSVYIILCNHYLC